MPAARILRGTEPGANEERPEVAWVVVRLVVVHLLGRAEPEAEGGELEEALPAPARHVDEAHAAGRDEPPQLDERLERLPEVLEDGDAEHDVERRVLQLAERFGQGALDRGDPLVGLEVRRERDVDEHGSLELRQHRPHEASLVAAAEVAHRLACERRHVTRMARADSQTPKRSTGL